MAEINFTKRTLDTLSKPEKGKRDTYHDTKLAGLSLRVSSTGVKSFSVRKRVNGKAERVTIGKYPAMTIEQARKKAAEINLAMTNGESVNSKKRDIRQEMTMGELFDLYLERHAKVHKKSWPNDVSQYNRHLFIWKGRKLSDINKRDVQKLHLSIGDKSGIYQANRVLALISSIFNRSVDWGWNGINPANGVKKFKEQSRDRFIEADELPRFFDALNQEPDTTLRDYFLLSILTGARRANLLSMRWDEINLKRSLWTIPHDKSKTGEKYQVPLVAQAISILKQRKSASKQSPWVLSSKRSKSGHIVEPKSAWARLLERAELKDLRLHDLRRSLGSWQAATGANLSVIGKSLGHKNVSTTAIYARLNLDPVREAMETATSAMLAAGGQLLLGDVVNIENARKKTSK